MKDDKFWTSEKSRAWQFNKQNVSVSNVLAWWQLLVFMMTRLTLPTNRRWALSETDQSGAWCLPSLCVVSRPVSGIGSDLDIAPSAYVWAIMATTHWPGSWSSNMSVSSFTLNCIFVVALFFESLMSTKHNKIQYKIVIFSEIYI